MKIRGVEEGGFKTDRLSRGHYLSSEAKNNDSGKWRGIEGDRSGMSDSRASFVG